MTETSAKKASVKTNILAVDDEMISREILKKTLEHQGYSVDAASDGKEALAIWEQGKHAIVITDCQMPNMSGFELASSVRNIEAQTQSANSTIIIALTANENEAEEKRCLAAGMDCMLSKPVSAEKLKSVLNRQYKKQPEQTERLQTTAKENIVDYSTLSEVFPDKSRQQLMLNTLQQHLQSAVIELYQHIENNNLNAIEAVAHRLKGACKMVGVNQVAASYNNIEAYAGLGHFPEEPMLVELKRNIAQFNTFIEHETNRAKAPVQSTASNKTTKEGD